MKTVNLGDTIYLPSAFYMSHGTDDFIGGKATVVGMRLQKSAGESVPFVNCKEDPACWYNWKVLDEEQEELKKEFGNKQAHADPDNRLEFNQWD